MPALLTRPHRLGLIALSLACLIGLACALFSVPARAQSAPQAAAIAVGGDNLTRLLWNNPAGSIALWRMAADGTVAAQYPYGRYPGWAASALAAGTDSAPCVLWNHSPDGQMSLWRADPATAAFTSANYGPYSGYAARGLAVGGDNVPRVLWNHPTDGLLSLWRVAPDTTYTYGNYGPYTGYRATVSPASVTGGSSATGTVTLTGNAPVGGTTVTLSSSSPSATVPPSVAVAAGTFTATFTVTTSPVSVAATATVTATYGAAKTASLTVNPAPSGPAYLSNLTLSSTAITGGSGATGTMTLSSPAPAGGTTVALHSNNPAATVTPSSLTVLAGASSATFTVTTTAVSASTTATLSAAYNGWTQGDELSVLPSNPPSVPPPGVPLIRVASGNGCAVVAWNRLADGTVSGYNVYRTSGGTTTLLTPKPFASNYYPDTGLTNDTATYSYQVAAVDTQGREQALSAPVSVTPSSTTVALNWINPPSAVTDRLLMDVSLSSSSGGQVFGTLFFIDGVQAGGGGDETLPVNGVQTEIAGAGYDSTELSNGPHTVQFLGFADVNRTIAAVTPPTPIQVSNTISSFHVDNSWFDPTQGELCYVFATAPAGSAWTVQAASQDGTTIFRTWQGASSLLKLAWDGKDAAGKPVPLADYALQIAVQPPGTSPQSVTPLGTKSAQPTPNAAPNAAGAAKKTRPVKMLHGQPIALALVSVSASYYKDSNGVPVVTPAQDIMLSNMLTNAYTTLFGASNFQVIKSDTFDPDREVKKGVTALKQLEGWLGTAQVFYLFGHGAGTQGPPGKSQTPRSTVFGAFDPNQGIHLELFPAAVAFPFSDEDIIVPTYVKSHNYVFAWIDSCNSAGGNSGTGQIGTPDYVWATAFNATTFIGDNGDCIINNNGPTGTSYWYKWRNTFWNNLAMGQDITQAYLNCWVVDGRGPGGTHLPYGSVDTGTYPDYYFLDPTTYGCTPGDGYGSNPRVVLYGEPDTTTLVPQ